MGFIDFTNGEVLTADQMDLVMRQGIMRFTDATARDTALSEVLAEGMMAYLDDTDEVLKYDGTSWIDISGDITGVTAGTALTGGGTSGNVTLDVDESALTIAQSQVTDLVSDLADKQDDVITTQGDIVIGDASGDAVRLPVGSADQVLTSDGTTVSFQDAGGGGSLLTNGIIVITNTQSITLTKSYVAFCLGGGGSGGASQSSVSQAWSGSGGGSGFIASGTISAGTYTATVGAGGSSSGTNSAGNSGGTTSIGAISAAGGGGGGFAGDPGGNGGSGGVGGMRSSVDANPNAKSGYNGFDAETNTAGNVDNAASGTSSGTQFSAIQNIVSLAAFDGATNGQVDAAGTYAGGAAGSTFFDLSTKGEDGTGFGSGGAGARSDRAGGFSKAGGLGAAGFIVLVEE